MKKISKYILIIVFMIAFTINVEAADFTCKYKASDQWVNINVKGTKVTRDDVSSGGSGWNDLDGGSEEIENWNIYAGDPLQQGNKFTGANYVATYKECPPYVLTFNETNGIEWHYFVSDEKNIEIIKSHFLKIYGKYDEELYYELKLVEGPGSEKKFDCKVDGYTITYNNSGEIVSVNDSSGNRVDKYLSSYFKPKSLQECPTNEIAEIKIMDGGRTFHVASFNDSAFINIIYHDNLENYDYEPKKFSDAIVNNTIKDNLFEVNGYDFLGWHATATVDGENKVIMNGKSKRLCKPGDKVKDIISIFGKIDDNTIHFYAQWKVKGDLTPIEIKEYGLGKSECERREFMWIGSEEDGYCNIDDLQFVYCGDAKDIPSYVPRIVSMIVNLLKIATPIILIFVSIISLLKAVASTNEDEIKKAQKGLTRKIVAAVLVFFVIQIVQFVIMKVADATTPSKINNQTEEKNVSSCLSCFLNNDCSGSTYYRYYLYGEYHYYRVEDSQEITLFNE